MARPPKKKDLRLGTHRNSEHADDPVVSLDSLPDWECLINDPVFHSLEVTFNLELSTVGESFQNNYSLFSLSWSYEHCCARQWPLQTPKDEDFSNSILSKLTEELQGAGDQSSLPILFFVDMGSFPKTINEINLKVFLGTNSALL